MKEKDLERYDIEYTPTNRERTMVASKDKYWCMKCDRALVGDYGKCPSCGYKQTNKRKYK